MRSGAHPRFIGLDVERGALRSELLDECFFSFVFYCQALGFGICFSRCKPDANVRSLHAFPLRESLRSPRLQRLYSAPLSLLIAWIRSRRAESACSTASRFDRAVFAPETVS